MPVVWSIDPGLRNAGLAICFIDDATDELDVLHRVSIITVEDPKFIPVEVKNVNKLSMTEWSKCINDRLTFYMEKYGLPAEVLIEQQRGGDMFCATRNLMIQSYITGFLHGKGICDVKSISPTHKFRRPLWLKIPGFLKPTTQKMRKKMSVIIIRQLYSKKVKADLADALFQLVVHVASRHPTRATNLGRI
jgi:hypothetical protein